MPSIIANSLRYVNADHMTDQFVNKPTYVAIGKSTAWPDDSIAPSLLNTTDEELSLLSDVIALKRVSASDMCNVVPRYNWTSGIVYDMYDHRINVINGRKPTGHRYAFYVMTDEFHVYKCISNNNGAPSTSKPASQSTSVFVTADGYSWKFMYTVKPADVFTFLTQEWMPVYTLLANDSSTQWNVQQAAIKGGIHAVTMTSQGTGYNASTPSVTITGDGTGATATAEVDATTGKIKRILVTNPGSGYTKASVNITSGAGTGAVAVAIISPLEGHGADARKELGGYYKMIKVNLAGDEGGKFPTNVSFRQTALIHKPLGTANGSMLVMSDVTGLTAGANVTGSSSGATGTIALVEQDTKIIWLKSVSGSFTVGDSISGKTVSAATNGTKIVLTDNTAAAADITKYSGTLMYMSNRTPITRGSAQTEEVRMVIAF